MTTLVTGAPGWLGTTLVDRLADRGTPVRVLAYPGVDVGELDPSDVEVVRGDVTEPSSLEPAVDGDVDTVVHCAGVNHPGPIGGVSTIHAINAEGTRNLATAAARHGVDHFVFISSIVAQGFNDGPDDVITEDTPARPRTEYGRSKLRAERYLERVADEHGLPHTILRPCWYYGPRQPDRMGTLMRQIAGGRPVMFGDGTNRRSMTHVPSLVDLICLALEDPAASTDEAFVVADDPVYTTNEIYATIAEALGVEEVNPIRLREPLPTVMKYVQRAAERLDVHIRETHVAWEMSRHIAADPAKAKTVLGWEPPTALAPGMAAAVEWARAHGQV